MINITITNEKDEFVSSAKVDLPTDSVIVVNDKGGLALLERWSEVDYRIPR